MGEQFDLLRRAVGIAALVTLGLPVITPVLATVAPLVVVVWAILSAGSFLSGHGFHR